MLEKNIGTTNLLAEIEQTEELFGTLIIMAHHDSKSQTLTTVQRSACLIFGVRRANYRNYWFLIQAFMYIIIYPFS